MNNDDDNIHLYPQRVAITLDLHYGTGVNIIAVHTLLNMLERLQDSFFYPSAAIRHFRLPPDDLSNNTDNLTPAATPSAPSPPQPTCRRHPLPRVLVNSVRTSQGVGVPEQVLDDALGLRWLP